MRIFVHTAGSTGDVRPFVALAAALQRRGHEVMVCTHEKFAPLVRARGLAYGAVSNGLLALLDTEAGKKAVEETNGLLGSWKSMRALLQEGRRIASEMAQDAVAAAAAFSPQVIIYHPKAVIGPSIAEAHRAKAVMAALQPMVVPTAAFPPIGVPRLGGARYNRWAYGLIEWGFRAYRNEVNQVRVARLGLDPLPAKYSILADWRGAPIPVLHGFSAAVVPRPADWPSHVHVCGYWFLDDGADWEPPEALRRFLEAGPPPVYVGFGSMAGRRPERRAQVVVAALQKIGARGILATGWGGLEAGELPDTVFPVTDVPHDWLFPQVAAVVHHGGAGTTAAGLRAGRPTVICPFMGDQPFWGRRVAALHAGPLPIAQKKLTVSRLVAALEQALTNPRIQEGAQRLGAALREEDGLGNAAAAVEAIATAEEGSPRGSVSRIGGR